MIIEFVKKNKIFLVLLVICILILVFKKRTISPIPHMLYPKKSYNDVIKPYTNAHRKQITTELVNLLNDSEDDYYKGMQLVANSFIFLDNLYSKLSKLL